MDDNAIAHARSVADRIRQLDPGKAAEIEAAIAEYQNGRREGLKVEASLHYRLEKFDGDYAADKAPIEVIEGTDNL